MNFFKRKKKNDLSYPPNRRRVHTPTRVQQEKSPRQLKNVLFAILRVCGTLAITALAISAGVGSYIHATTSPYFAVTDFKTTGLVRLKEAEILKTANIARGTNIFKVDRERATQLLKEHVWIANARVERRLPRTLFVEIEERREKAVVFFDVPYLVDRSGDIFKRWVHGDPIPAPVLTGFTREQFSEDRDAVREAIRNAIALAERYEQSPLAKIAPLAEIHREVDGSFSLTLHGDATYVRFGEGPFRQKLERLATILKRLKREGRSADMIYFDNETRPNRVTVKLKGATRTEAG